MADRSKIEWTDASWTPIRARNVDTGKVGWHCEHVSEGCRHCYAEGINKRLGTGLSYKPGLVGPGGAEIFRDEKMLLAPVRWKRPRMIFVCSMTDLFAEFVSDEMIDRVFAVMALCPQHTFQVLTKRPKRMREWTNNRMIEGMCGAVEHRAKQIARDIRKAIPVGKTLAGTWPWSHIWFLFPGIRYG